MNGFSGRAKMVDIRLNWDVCLLNVAGVNGSRSVEFVIDGTLDVSWTLWWRKL